MPILTSFYPSPYQIGAIRRKNLRVFQSLSTVLGRGFHDLLRSDARRCAVKIVLNLILFEFCRRSSDYAFEFGYEIIIIVKSGFKASISNAFADCQQVF